ncbi:AlpA family phage regulatory protein [Hydrogenophaga sp. D2P1]|uniref:AlpA family phage regulatory protein n=1 Tax=Hydrogenophaga aromaticivorans TaxID=2610898 RepID=A0A7Y8GTA8_9BURK|nr:AlpA family phage regulatory protein [Hydrogenophaga aromaticivorans]
MTPHVHHNLDPLLREPARRAVTGVSRSAWYVLMAKDEAPKPVHVSSRSVAWRSSDLQKWAESRQALEAAK